MSQDPAPVVSPTFRQELHATAADIDGLGHVNNIVYVRWVQDAATGHSRAVGWDFAAYQRAGVVFVVRKHEIEYLVPALEGDAIVLETWVEKWTPVTSIRRTRILRASDQVELARASTLWVMIGATDGKPCRIPKELAAAFLTAPTAPAR